MTILSSGGGNVLYTFLFLVLFERILDKNACDKKMSSCNIL